MDENLTKGERTSQAIIEAAYRLFVEQGYHATSMRQIAQGAGVALGGIYNHFNGKEDIYDRVILDKHPYRRVLQILQNSPGEDVEAFAINAARTMQAELQRQPDLLKLALVELIEFKAKHIPLLVQNIFPHFYPLLQRFQSQENKLRDLPRPVILVSFLATFFSYFLAQNVFPPGSSNHDEFGALEQYMDVFLHGVIDPNRLQSSTGLLQPQPEDPSQPGQG